MMKRAMGMLALMLTVLPSLAAAQLRSNEKVVTQVPFEFWVANKIVPAGQYWVRTASMDGSALMIQNFNANVSLVAADLAEEKAKPSDHYSLVFKKYGDQHFLWEIRIKGSRMVCRLPESKAEAELRAKNMPATEEILLASGRK